MKAGMTSAAVRFSDALAFMAAASVALAFLLPGPSLAETPAARTSSVTSLEDQLLTTPERAPPEARQPVFGYLRHTEEGWKLDMLPGAVPRNGPLPPITSTADAPLEDLTSHTAYPYAPVFRFDF